MEKYTTKELEKIVKSVSLIDYFQYLERNGRVEFDRKYGKDYYFKTDNNKFSVSDSSFYDFKTGRGGKIIKAVMEMEDKRWKEAVDFFKDFGKVIITSDLKQEFAEKRENIDENTNNDKSETKIIRSILPNNKKLIEYFESRGISKEVLKKNAKQIHYEAQGKRYFGIGLENQSGGYEIRNPMMKTKIGKNDITIVKGDKQDEMVVFEGFTDMLSFLQLMKDNGRENRRTLICLNSVTNTDKFIGKILGFKGKMFLLLDGDSAGNLATEKIKNGFGEDKVKDIRQLYGIYEGGNNDLNDYLKKKHNLVNKKKYENTTSTTESRGVSNLNRLERSTSKQNIGRIGSQDESKQVDKPNSQRGQNVGSNDVRNGLTSTDERSDGRRHRGRTASQSVEGTQRKSNEEKHSLGGRLLTNSTNIVELDKLIAEYKGLKISNEQVTEIVSVACFVSNHKSIHLKENLKITEDLKDLINQYQTGGVAKAGRGILDEYYTNSEIVNSVRKMLNRELQSKNNLSVLEPSVGTGNFLYAVEGFPNAKINTFEINETAAKISKILHSNINVNLRSFETEFIGENGIKKDKDSFIEKYDLVIGNPPYGNHRGFYKGLGEEPKISKYENYFVKRSLDSLKEGGTLAMVLPSSWLNSQKKINNADLINAYRLPVGAFKGTQVGTDIILLKKDSQKQNLDISHYFEKHQDNVLGEIREKTNRFGRLEKYVYGNLEDALAVINEQSVQKEKTIQLSLFPSDVELKILDEKYKISTKESNIDLAIKKTKVVQDVLSQKKFKTPAVQKEIDKYEKLHQELTDRRKPLGQKKLNEIVSKADKIIQNTGKKKTEYKLQKEPNIKKGILKYKFSKEDKIVNTSLQNNPSISEEQIEAFRNTEYNGALKNPDNHKKYANYINGVWVHDFYYAEGNIYDKLEQLERDFTNKGLQYEKQKTLLDSVLPKKKSLDEIIISPNHEFVHKFDLGKVEKEIYNYQRQKNEIQVVDYTLAEKFKDFVRDLPYDAFRGSSAWEVNAFVNNETVTGSDRERNALVRERRKEVANDLFQKFIEVEMTDAEKERYVNEFNRNYNNIHIPNYSNFPLFSKIYHNFKGRPLRLTEVQKSGIGRLTTKGVGALAHEVGFGKTLSGILSMHEAMERGNAKRPLIVVPNDNILKQWVETIYETIPGAKINVLGNLGKDYELSNFDNKDSEITLVTYSGFNNIGFSNEVTERLADKFSYISENELKNLKNTTVREEQQEIEKQKEVQGKMKKGKIYDWEDFGFDHLTFDEVHNANHIVGKVKIEDRRFASDFRSQNQRTSALGINTWMASQYIQENYDGRNVTLLSATPFTNKPLEYYSILSLVANNRLEEKGYFNVNTFFETFMEADNEMEIDAKGDINYKSNVKRFKNNAVFQQLLGEFIDIKGEEDNPELIRPNRINKEYKIKQNEITREQYEFLNDNFTDNDNGAILTHILNARLIAISPYLSPYYEGKEPMIKEFIEKSPKLKSTMDLIAQNKKDNPNAGQIIYSELAVNEFPKLKQYLIDEVKFEYNEVALITGKVSKAQRIKIQNDFNDGKIKVVIGSSAIQEGMNLQTNTSDMYLLSLPYNFTSLRQTEGRAWRQGNKFENVRINYMLTEDSIDVFMLQKLQAKQARYLEAMKKDINILDISDIDTGELKTALITNPETRAQIEIKIKQKRLESEKSRLIADSSFIFRKIEKITELKKKITDYEEKTEWIAKNYAPKSDYHKKNVQNRKIVVNSMNNELKRHISKLKEQGVDFLAAQRNSELTDEKVKVIEAEIEKLPMIKEDLVIQYREEKEKKDRLDASVNFVEKRAEENRTFYKLREYKTEISEEKTRIFRR